MKLLTVGKYKQLAYKFASGAKKRTWGIKRFSQFLDVTLICHFSRYPGNKHKRRKNVGCVKSIVCVPSTRRGEKKKIKNLHFCHKCRQILNRWSNINTCKHISFRFLRNLWLITVGFEIVCFRWNSTNSKFRIFCLSCLPILCTLKNDLTVL